MFSFRNAPMFFCVQYCAEPPGVRTLNESWLCRAVTPPPWVWAGMTEPHSLRRGGALAFTRTHSLSPAARPYHRPGLLLLFPSGSFLIFPLSTNLTPRLKVFSGVDIIHDVTPTKSTNRAGVERRVWLDRSAVIQRSAAASASLDFVPPDHFSFR